MDQLTDGADATVTEVVDVVSLNADLHRLTITGAGQGLLPRLQRQHVFDGGDNVFFRHSRLVSGN